MLKMYQYIDVRSGTSVASVGKVNMDHQHNVQIQLRSSVLHWCSHLHTSAEVPYSEVS
jgi:hypothetical protein